MAKSIIQQARGHGSLTYRVRRRAFIYRLSIPRKVSGEGTVVKLLHSGGHTCPVAKIVSKMGVFYIPAFENMFEGQKIQFENGKVEAGNILRLKDVPVKTKVYCVESRPDDGGKYIKAGGLSAVVNRKVGNKVYLNMPSKKEKEFHEECRCVVGVIAGHQRKEKPIVKAGKMHYIKKTKNKLWPRTSAIKVNAIDHPFGSGRGKNPKSKIAKRNAPAGRRVGLLRPKQTGKRK